MSDRYEDAEKMRQALLNYVNANPNSRAPEVARSLGFKHSIVSSTLRAMADLGELKRHGSGISLRFTACKTTTITAAEMMAKAKKRCSGRPSETRNDRSNVMETGKPYLHDGMERSHPLPAQGGQGAIRCDIHSAGGGAVMVCTLCGQRGHLAKDCMWRVA